MNKSFTETINWVSVDERLPDWSTSLLVIHGGTVEPATYDPTREHDRGGLFCIRNFTYLGRGGTVTHWAEWPKGEVK